MASPVRLQRSTVRKPADRLSPEGPGRGGRARVLSESDADDLTKQARNLERRTGFLEERMGALEYRVRALEKEAKKRKKADEDQEVKLAALVEDVRQLKETGEAQGARVAVLGTKMRQVEEATSEPVVGLAEQGQGAMVVKLEGDMRETLRGSGFDIRASRGNGKIERDGPRGGQSRSAALGCPLITIHLASL
jgi:hypothetical protein